MKNLWKVLQSDEEHLLSIIRSTSIIWKTMDLNENMIITRKENDILVQKGIYVQKMTRTWSVRRREKVNSTSHEHKKRLFIA